jgi:hypothetical protein
MKAVVFFGPSIEAERVDQLLSATHAGPVKRGDLHDARDFDLVIILDGEFGQNLSVSPKEILALLDAGRTVIGAASMGALRASELDHFGMIGVGWIYRRFKRSPVRRDDDVALTYSPVDGRAVTIPMVNVEFWTECLTRLGQLSAGEAKRVCRAARSIFFAERTEETLMTRLRQLLGPARIEALLRHTDDRIPDIKRQDAEAALRHAALLVHHRALQSSIVHRNVSISSCD